MNHSQRCQLRPQLESMESRITPVGFFSQAQVLYNAQLRDHVQTAAAEQSQRVRPVPPRVLSGAVSGTYQLSSSTLDANTSGTVSGSGSVNPVLGNVTVSGKVGPIASSRAGFVQGTVTLTNNQGTLTLGLSARLPRNLSSLANIRSATLTVIGGTGVYSNAVGLGAGTAVLNFNPVQTSSNTGTFSVTIHTPRIRGIA